MLEIYKPRKVSIYDNRKSRYTAAQVKAVTGAYIVFNGGLFDMGTLQPNCDIKVNGAVLNDDKYTYMGYGWKNGELPKPTHTNDMPKVDNYFSCVWAITDGKKEEKMIYDRVALGGYRGRTGWGFTADGLLVSLCTTDSKNPMTMEQAQDKLYQAGCVSGIINDGGGSCQRISPKSTITSSRIVSNYICVWIEKAEQPAPKPTEHEIIKTSLSWGGALTTRSVTNEEFHHHAAGYGSVYDIHNYHRVVMGWLGIAYNFYVTRDGKIYEGRPINKAGGHTVEHNTTSIGICAEGNYEVDEMPVAQREALRWLCCEHIARLYPSATPKRHRDVNSTACPGKNYPFDYITGKTGQAPTTPNDVVQIAGGGVKLFQVWLNAYYFSKLVEDGIYGARTKAAAIIALQKTLNAQYRAGLVVDGIWGTKTQGAIRAMYTGSRGDDVAILQGMLYCHGCDPQGIDGTIGANTKDAVRAFQRAQKLSVDGVAGKQTFAALVK